MPDLDKNYYLDREGLNTLIREFEANIIAYEYDPTVTYSRLDYCIHDNKLYQCFTDTTGTWNEDDWYIVAIGDVLNKVRQESLTDAGNHPVLLGRSYSRPQLITAYKSNRFQFNNGDEDTPGLLTVYGRASFRDEVITGSRIDINDPVGDITGVVNLSTHQINGVIVGGSPKFTDTTYTFAGGTNSFTVTPEGGTAQTVSVTPSITNNITGSGTSGKIAAFTGANTIGDGYSVDTSVTSGSANLVTSGAVYTAIDNLPDSDTWRNIKVNGTELLGSAISTGAINFKSGTNTTVSGSGNDITISSTDTNTTYSLTQNASDGHKITLTPSSGTAQTITIPDNNTTYSMTRDGANVKLTPSSGSAQSVGLSELINGLGEGTSPAQGTDYLVAQYAGGGTSTTSYHRRSVSNVVNSTVVKAALGTGSGTTKYLREDGTWVQPPNTNTTYTFANGTNGFTVTPSGGSAQTVTVTPSITNNVTGSGTNGYLAKFNGAHTITNGVALGSSTTTFLRNDGTWATPSTGTDTKNTAGSTNNTGKLFLVGALEQSANPQTYSNSGVSVKGSGELSAHTWSVKNSNDYSRTESYVDAEDRGRINVYDENGIGRIMLAGSNGILLNDTTDTTTIFLDSENGRVECEKMSYTKGTVTFSKSSGSWTFANGEYTRSGQVVQIRLSFKGGGSNVSVGSNAIAGTVNGISKPPYTVRLQGYYSGTVLMGELTSSGGFNIRVLGQALNLSSSNTATLSGTYIVED